MRRGLRSLRPSLSLLMALASAGAMAQTAPQRLSGYHFMSPATQALQDDDAQNPAFLWVKDGQQRFESTCLRCHSVASLRGVAARHPAWDVVQGKPLTLSARINACQVRHVKGAPFAPESDGLLALESFVAHQSRGQPIVSPTAPQADPRLAPAVQQGARLYAQRIGQLDFSCAQCHDQNAGRRLGGSTIPQGHPTGYPLYRLEWQGVGSLQRRLRHCMSGVRAEPYAFASDELTALELYLMQRATGMPLDTPAVRP
jgi:sulfur-oxidizing protein SoxA